jgi:hypothetical protein
LPGRDHHVGGVPEGNLAHQPRVGKVGVGGGVAKYPPGPSATRTASPPESHRAPMPAAASSQDVAGASKLNVKC